MVGVYNTKRNRMDLYPLEGDAVIGLHLTAVTGSVSARTVGGAGSSGVSGGLEGLNARERRDMVIADFGSKQKQKMERSRKANIVDIAAVAAAGDIAGALKSGSSKATAAAAATGGAEGEGEGASSSSSGAAGIGATSAAKVDAALMRARLATLPPFDDKATQASRAYPLERMIPGEIFRAMARTASALMRAIREADEAEASGRVAPGLRTAAEAAKAREEAEAEGGAADGAAYVRSVAEVVRQFGRESDFVQDRLTRLLPAIRAEAAAEAAAAAAEGDDGEGEEGGPADGSHAALDSLLADADAAAAAAEKARERKKASRRRRAAAAGDGVPVFRKVVALLYLRALLVLHRCPDELRYRRVPMPVKGSKGGADAAASAGAGAGAEADAAAAAEPVPTKVAVPQLKYLADPVVAGMLATFTEARPDSRSDAGSLASAAMKSVAAAAAAAAADGADDAAKAKAAAAAASAAAAAAEPPLPAVVHTRTAALTDKLRAYAAALALTADDFSCDVRLLAKDMRIVPARMAVAFRELGCTLKPLRVDDEAAAGGAGAAASAAADDAEEVDDEELAAEASDSEDEGSDGDGEVKDSRGKKDKAAEAKAKAKAKAAKAKAAAAAAAAKGGKARGPIVSYLAFLKVPLVFPALKLGRGK